MVLPLFIRVTKGQKVKVVSANNSIHIVVESRHENKNLAYSVL